MISAILLAAGQSKRMNGDNKLIKKYNKKYLINHIIGTLIKSKVNKIIVVLGFQKSKVRKIIVKNKKINLNIPITLFHGLKDEVVPLMFSKKILKIFPKAKKKLIKIKSGDHSLSKKNDLKKICKELNHIISDHI